MQWMKWLGLAMLAPVVWSCGSAPPAAPDGHYTTLPGPTDMPCWMQGTKCCFDEGTMCAYGSVHVKGQLLHHPQIVRDLGRAGAMAELVKFVRVRARTTLDNEVTFKQTGSCREQLDALKAIDAESTPAGERRQSEQAAKALQSCAELDPVENTLLKMLTEENHVVLKGVYHDGLWEDGRQNVHVCYRVRLADLRSAIRDRAGNGTVAGSVIQRIFPELKDGGSPSQ